MSNAYINQRCFHTYQFVVTRPFGGGNYVGYTGYKRCSPFLRNPIVEIYADGSLVVSKTAPDFYSDDFYGEEFSLGSTASSRVRFVVKGIDVESDVEITEVPTYTCPSEPCSIGGSGATILFGQKSGTSPAADIQYTVVNNTGSARGAKLELWYGGSVVNSSTAVVDNGAQAVLRVVHDDANTEPWTWRTYTYKLYDCDTSFVTCNLVEVAVVRVWYYGGDAAGGAFSDDPIGSDIVYSGWNLSPSRGTAGSYVLWYFNTQSDRTVNVRDSVNSTNIAASQYKINLSTPLTRTYPDGTVTEDVYVDNVKLGYYTITGTPPPPPPAPSCQPIFRTGIDAIDSVIFCIGGYGVTVSVLLMALILVLLLTS